MVKVWVAAVALLAMVTGGAVAPQPAEAGAGELPTLLGWAPGTAQAMVDQSGQIEAATGKVPALGMLPFTVEQDWSESWISPRLAQISDLGVTPYLELTVRTEGAFHDLAAGRLDGQLDQMIATLRDYLDGGAGRSLVLAPLPEMNLVDHPWGTDPARFRQAFHRIRGRVLDAGLTSEQVRFVFAPNGLSSPGFSYPEFYPGDGAVDIVGFAKINRGTPWRDYDETFAMHLAEMRATVTTSKPILITQTGSVEGAPGREGWLHDMFTRLHVHEQVLGAVYFNRDKASDGDLRVLVDGKLSPTVARDYRDLWDAPSAADWIFDGSLDAWVDGRGGVPAARFADTARSIFRDDIAEVADRGITAGCGPDLYCPRRAVTRAQMASFLATALDLPAAPGGDRFTDDDGSVHEDAIERVAAAGITRGCGGSTDRFCPGAPVNRAQMASFLAAAFDLPPADEPDRFTDDDGLVHEDAIDRVAAADITTGCSAGADRFCPSATVTRDQMAAFLLRGLNR